MHIRYFSCTILSVFSILILNACQEKDLNSRLKLETDDRESEATARLTDVSERINTYINQTLSEARKKVNPESLEWTENLRFEFVKEVGHRLGNSRPGTGIGIYLKKIDLGLEISTLSEIEFYFQRSLTPGTEVIRVPFKDSRYGDNKIGYEAMVLSHLLPSTAEHSISPIVRTSDAPIGLDKLGHFAEQGFWYFLSTHNGQLTSVQERLDFGRFMEGDPELDSELHPKFRKIFASYCRPCALFKKGFGYFGMESTGVCSFADIEANESGYQFYQRLYESPQTFVFDIGDFDVHTWNEAAIPSVFKPGLKVRE